jgi:hypothetical protein
MRRLGRAGQQVVHSRFHADAMAEAAWNTMKMFLREREQASPEPRDSGKSRAEF